MPVEYAGTTSVASRLLRYTVKPKPGQTAQERVLHIAGQNCRPVTAEREFAATRRRHGTQGATRKSPATYVLPEPGDVATHVRRTRPNGRRYWAVAKSGEEATHVRHEGEVVRQAEARHLITSFGRDEVNPSDPEQVAKAFEYVVARHSALYPGEQATFVGQAEGKGLKFHVHTTRNATLYQDMEVDGKLYGAGRKLAGDLTDIDKMRERADRFLAERGHEYDLVPQRLPSVSERKKEMRNQRDRRMAAEGALSNHDQIRQAFEASMDDPRAVHLDAWKAVMAERGVTVTEPGWRRDKPPKVPRLSYQLSGMSTPVRAKTLGEHYDHASTLGQLDANAQGFRRERRPERQCSGQARPIALPTDDELSTASAIMKRLGHEERLDAWLDDWAREEKLGEVTLLLAERGMTESYPADREKLHLQMREWHAAHEKREREQMEASFSSSGEQQSDALLEDEAMVVEPEQAAPASGVLKLVIVEEALVKYGFYRPDSSAMDAAGIEPTKLNAAIESWNSLPIEEQRSRYLEIKATQERIEAAQKDRQIDLTTDGVAAVFSAQSDTGPLDYGFAKEERPQTPDTTLRAHGARHPVLEENPHAVAARKGRAQSAARRRALQCEGNPARSADAWELGG